MSAPKRAGQAWKGFSLWTIWLALSGVAMTAPAYARQVAAPAHAQSIPAPRVSVNDTWTYHHKGRNRTGWHDGRSTLTVRRASANEIVVAITHPDSDMATMERMFPANWSIERTVNGRPTVVNQPLAFPLSVGKTWKIAWTEDHPNPRLISQRVIETYRVTGWDDVTVPAGTFHALKIEADGTWSTSVAPAASNVSSSLTDDFGTTTVERSLHTTPRINSGRMYKAFWYVPDVKRWVKASEEYYNGNGVRYEWYSDELESWKIAK